MESGGAIGRPPLWKRLRWRRILILLVGVLLAGRYFLSGFGLTETDRVLQAVDKAEQAVEKESILQLRSVLSEDYQDSSGLSRQMMLALASRYFQLQEKTQIVQLSRSVEFPQEDRAVVDLRVQVFGRAGGQWGRGLSDDSAWGEKYTIRLAQEEGKWKITAVNPAKGKWPGGGF